MSSYDADELRRLLELWQRDDATLSSDQMQALVDWEGTPEDVRAPLKEEIAELGAGIKPAPPPPAREE